MSDKQTRWRAWLGWALLHAGRRLTLWGLRLYTDRHLIRYPTESTEGARLNIDWEGGWR